MNRLRHIMLLLLVSTLVVSCSDDSYHYPSVRKEFYTLHTGRTGSPETIETDDGQTLAVAEDKSGFTSAPDTALRVVGCYEPVDGGVRIYSPSPTVSYIPVSASVYADSASTAPVSLQSMWGGLKYLNIVLEVKNAGGRHRLLLLEDSVRRSADGGNVYLSIYHNAYGDSEAYVSRACMSLSVEDYLRSVGAPLNVNVSFLNYGGTRETRSVSFR